MQHVSRIIPDVLRSLIEDGADPQRLGQHVLQRVLPEKRAPVGSPDSNQEIDLGQLRGRAGDCHPL